MATMRMAREGAVHVTVGVDTHKDAHVARARRPGEERTSPSKRCVGSPHSARPGRSCPYRSTTTGIADANDAAFPSVDLAARADVVPALHPRRAQCLEDGGRPLSVDRHRAVRVSVLEVASRSCWKSADGTGSSARQDTVLIRACITSPGTRAGPRRGGG